MGMYPVNKEIPSEVLKKLLTNPKDEKFVDSLLFNADTNWTPELLKSNLSEEELNKVFICPHINFTVEQKISLGELDLGKYPYYETDFEFRCFLRLAEAQYSKINISKILYNEKDGLSEIMKEPATDITNSKTSDKTVRKGFHSDVPCYGICSYSTPEELQIKWQKIEQIFKKYPEHISQFLKLYEDKIFYYYGCAMRKNADLYIMW